MKKLIDINDTTFEALSILAIKKRTNLKSYIEFVLDTHASEGSKKENLKKNKINQKKP